MSTVFRITKPGLHRRRDGEIADMRNVTDTAKAGSVEIWCDANTGTIYYPDGFYTANPDLPNGLDIVERIEEPVKPQPPGVHEISKVFLFNQQPAYEHIPDRLAIATKLLAGMLAHSGDERIDHIMHADALVHNAVTLTDKLIARVQEIKK